VPLNARVIERGVFEVDMLSSPANRRTALFGLAVVTAAVAFGCPGTPAVDGGPSTSDAGDPTDAGSDAGPVGCPELPTSVAEGRTGSDDDTIAQPRRAVVLMGGSVEVDASSKLFVESAGGGDVLVLRASGSTESYLPYFASELSPSPEPSSVAVLRTDEPDAAGAAVACRVEAAEAVWLAGGDQWDYLGGWPTVLHEALASTVDRQTVIGGTSAGAMSLGEFAFDAALGSVSSAEALADPAADVVSVSVSTFGQPELVGHLVDTHFSERDREGRLLAMLAHARSLSAVPEVRAIALDEQASIAIENGGFIVQASPDRAVYVYRFAGEANLSLGEPLTMTGVERVELADRDQGVWPLDFDSWDASVVDVTDGVVSAR
jgi:cyanophycinase-like exopeptidase